MKRPWRRSATWAIRCRRFASPPRHGAYLGKQDEAHKCAATFLQSYPTFRVDHWLSIVPDRNADDRRHYEVGLKLAGFR